MIVSGYGIPLTLNGSNEFDRRVTKAIGGPLCGSSIRTVQVNIGLKCNLACRHCHVESSPKRVEEMSWKTMELVLEAACRSGARTLDITGGAPEMNPNFRRLVASARDLRLDVMVRTNLTIMLEDGFRDLPEFLRTHNVHLVASLPCYLKENVNRQRGLHVFEESVEVIRMLNGVEYGRCDDLRLDLVYNPLGPSLPPSEAELESDYRRILKEQFGIDFSRLIAITNLPIGRFQHDLDRRGTGDDYLRLLRDSFNPNTIEGLMCRHQLHVGYDGTLYDCDFHFAMHMPASTAAAPESSRPPHVRDFDPDTWRARRVVTAEHCFGCTAGRGSSCGGEIVK